MGLRVFIVGVFIICGYWLGIIINKINIFVLYLMVDGYGSFIWCVLISGFGSRVFVLCVSLS